MEDEYDINKLFSEQESKKTEKKEESKEKSLKDKKHKKKNKKNKKTKINDNISSSEELSNSINNINTENNEGEEKNSNSNTDNKELNNENETEESDEEEEEKKGNEVITEKDNEEESANNKIKNDNIESYDNKNNDDNEESNINSNNNSNSNENNNQEESKKSKSQSSKTNKDKSSDKNSNNKEDSKKSKESIIENINKNDSSNISSDSEEKKSSKQDLFNKYINQTNEYNRKNINSSISPDDPMLTNVIISKEKDLKLNSEDLISQHRENPSKKYKVLDILGSGSFGKVFKALNTLTKNLVAIKKTKKFFNKNKDYDQPAYINVKNEIEILKKLSHPNIVKIYEFYDIREFYFIINEYCKYGDLSNFYKFHLSEKQICIIIYQILTGLAYLHENNIIHRDLKLENIMVDHIEKDLSTSEPYFFVKIIDFGSAKIFNRKLPENLIIGTSYYMAPEVINKKYNEKCDLWSLGVILYMLIAKKPPFDAKDKEKIFERILKEKYNKNSASLLEFSEEVRDLIDKLLEKNANKRITAKGALIHPWFNKCQGRAIFANFKLDDFNLILDKLFNAKKMNKLQDLVVSFLVHNSPSNYENIKIMKIFRFLNEAGDCKLSRNELKKRLYKYKIKSEVNLMVNNLFEKMEIYEDNGYIEYEKFIGFCIDKEELFSKENLRYAFNFINDNQGESINSQQIIKAFNIKDDPIYEALFNDLIIKNGKKVDGTLTFSEFEGIIRS